MRTVLRPRHYCDHCKKSGGRKDLIAAHELVCTANPNRVCGCCRLAGSTQPTIEQMREAVSLDYVKRQSELAAGYNGDDRLWADHGDLTNLREVTNGCPACILAAFRQIGVAAEFDFKTEMAVWIDKYGETYDDR